MNEHRELQKELDEKSSLDEYKKKLAATIGLSGVTSTPVAISVPLLIDNSSTVNSSIPLTEFTDDPAIPVPMDDLPTVVAKDVATETATVATILATPSEAVNTEINTADFKTSSTDVSIFSDSLPFEMATSSSKQMAVATPADLLAAAMAVADPPTSGRPLFTLHSEESLVSSSAGGGDGDGHSDADARSVDCFPAYESFKVRPWLWPSRHLVYWAI